VKSTGHKEREKGKCWKFAGRLLDRVNTPKETGDESIRDGNVKGGNDFLRVPRHLKLRHC